MDKKIIGYMVLESIQKTKNNEVCISIENRGIFHSEEEVIENCPTRMFGYLKIFEDGSIEGMIYPHEKHGKD